MSRKLSRKLSLLVKVNDYFCIVLCCLLWFQICSFCISVHVLSTVLSMFHPTFHLCSVDSTVHILSPVLHLRFCLHSVYVTIYVPSTVLTMVMSMFCLWFCLRYVYVQSISVSVMSPFCQGSFYVLLTVLSSQISHFLEGIPMVDKH